MDLRWNLSGMACRRSPSSREPALWACNTVLRNFYFRHMPPPVIDLTFLGSFCKGDQARKRQYIRLYVEGSPALFAALADRLQAGDGEGLALAAHSLRPQVHYMGAQALLELLTALEERARAEGAAACAASVAEALRCNEQVLTALREHLAGS